MGALTANCRATSLTNVCADLLQASGVDKDFWGGYVSDLSVKISLTMSGPIANLQFYPYSGLFKYQGRKYSHKFDTDDQVAPGGNISQLHKGMVKVMALNTADDVSVLRLKQAQDLFIVFQDNNEQFKIAAPSKGFSLVPGPSFTTGQAENEDTMTVINLQSVEKVPFLRFDRGSTTQANIDYLDSLVIG